MDIFSDKNQITKMLLKFTSMIVSIMASSAQGVSVIITFFAVFMISTAVTPDGFSIEWLSKLSFIDSKLAQSSFSLDENDAFKIIGFLGLILYLIEQLISLFFTKRIKQIGELFSTKQRMIFGTVIISTIFLVLIFTLPKIPSDEPTELLPFIIAGWIGAVIFYFTMIVLRKLSRVISNLEIPQEVIHE